jgi:predicted RNA-binding protein YlxR (DUF448 family)
MTAGDGVVTIDPDGRRGGRGMYLCRDPDCARRAERRGAFSRRLRQRVDVPDKLERELVG